VTYEPGLLETRVDGALNIGVGSAIGSTQIVGATVNISRDSVNPAIVMSRQDILGEGRIEYDGTKLLMGAIGISGEVYDSFGSPGAAGQQLQSSGPGLPFVWGAGSGVGLTAVVAGSNIGVDNTNPIAPVVSVAISSTLDMSGQEMINASDITLRGATSGVNFKDTLGADQGDLTYIESNDRLRLQSGNVLINTDNTDQYRIQMGESLGALDVTTLNKPIRLIRNDATNTVVQSRLDLNATSVDIEVGDISMIVSSSDVQIVKSTPDAALLLSMIADGNARSEARFSNTAIGDTVTVGYDPTYNGALLNSDTDITVRASNKITLDALGGNVEILAVADTAISASVNGGTASMTLTDNTGEGTATLGAKFIVLSGEDVTASAVGASLTMVGSTGTGTVDVAAGDYIKLDAAGANTLTMNTASSVFDSGAGGADTAFQVLQNGGTAEFTLSAASGSYTGILSAENGLDLVSAVGQVRVTNPDGTWDLFKPAYGNFSSTATQSAVPGGTRLLFNTTGVASDVAIGGAGQTSRIIPTYPGVYKIAYSIQLFKSSAGLSAASVYISKSNSAQSNTTRSIRLFDTEAVPISSDFVIQITSGQFIEVFLQSTDGTVQALAGEIGRAHV
jgi:hypothetical protein